MPSRPAFVDTYVHFIDPFNPGFTYPSMRSHPLLGDHLDLLHGKRFDARGFVEASRSSGLVAAIHADADAGAVDPATETAWVQSQASTVDVPMGILGLVDLTRPDAPDTIVRHLEHHDVRGIRHRSPSIDFFEHPDFDRHYGILETHGLSCEVGSRPPGTTTKLRDLARRFPGIPVTLNHCGIVLSHGGKPHEPEFFENWRRRLATIATAENVFCKISGIPVFDHNWTVDSLRPWVVAAIETFGPARCMFGSHWPYDMLFSGFEALIGAYAEIIGEFSADEQADLIHRNALSLYRI